jgi:glutamate-1-semialdehyde 2,1-aminomutase
MHALRLARAYTRREKFIMFEGQYHGVHDYVMFSAGGRNDWQSSRRSPAPIPFSSGIPDAVRSLVILLPYNDPETLERIVRQTWHDVAAILVEPVMGNCGGILPAPGWLETIRRLCDEHGIVFLMDEVKTGFRLARGGAQEYFGVHSDLTTFAKALGNGYPIAAFGGKREIMQHIGRGVSHAGTYAGNRIGLAAASATLDILMKTDALETAAERGRELQAAIAQVLERTGRPFAISGHPSMFNFWFAEQPPREYRDWAHSDHRLYDDLMAAMIERGVMPEPDSREPWFMCSAHSTQDIAETATVLEDAAREVLK